MFVADTNVVSELRTIRSGKAATLPPVKLNQDSATPIG